MYSTKRVNETHYIDIIRLYKLCFGKKINKPFVKNKFDTNNLGIIHVGYVAKDDKDDIAAHYSVFPMILVYKSKEFLIAQSGDTMTSPNHQKKGLFVKLATETYKLAEELGIKLIFGFPNNNSYYGFKEKLDWVFTGSLKKFSIRTFALPLCELSSKLPFISKFYASYTKWVLKNYEIDCDAINLNEFNLNNSNGYIKKDKFFFINCLKKENNYMIKIHEFYLLIKVETHLIIGDVAFIDKKQGEKLIQVCKELAIKLCCQKIEFYVSDNHWLYQILIDFLEPSDGLPIGFRKITNEINPKEIQFIRADFDTF